MNTNITIPNWTVPKNIKAIVTTNNNGNSIGKYQSFNLATHVGDDMKAVIENRNVLAKLLPSQPIWLTQTHSTKVLNLSNKNTLIPVYNNEYDATITNQPLQVAAILTADCLPILLTDKNGSFVAAIHAGWRGLLNGIITNTLTMLHSINPSNILSYIGPSICQRHFEVGSELYDRFSEKDCTNSQYFTHSSDNKFLCNLAAIAKQELLNNGLIINNITSSGICTHCNNEFYSYRRDGITGRFASLIWLTS